MWIIRKMSPWQDQNKLYKIGNPIVYVSKKEFYWYRMEFILLILGIDFLY